MSQFEYVIAFVSILLALAVAEILAGLGRLIRERDHVRLYWVHVAWMLLVILATTQTWWNMWNIRSHEFESYFEFMAMILPQLSFVLVAFLLAPPVSSDRPFDLREYYFHQARWIAPLSAAFFLGIAFYRSLIGVEAPLTSINGIRIVVAGLLVTLGFSKNPRVHEGAVFMVGGLFFVTVVIFSLQRG